MIKNAYTERNIADNYVPCCRCGKKPLHIDHLGGIFPSTDKSRNADLICDSILCLIEEMDALKEIGVEL